MTAHIDRELAARPQLVSIETAWRSPKEQRPGALQRNQYRELDTPDNPDAEPPCNHTKSAIVVFGKHAGRTLTVCTDSDCPVHNPREAARVTADPPPVMAPAPAKETKQQAAQRQAEHEQRVAEYHAEQKRKEEERKAEWERQQKEYEAEQTRREKQRKARVSAFERIIDQAPATFSAVQLRAFLRLLIQMEPYEFLEVVAAHFASNDENTQHTDEEIMLAALDATADGKLTGLALRIVLSDHVGIPRDDQPDLLTTAEQVFAPRKPKLVKSKAPAATKAAAAKTSAKAPAKQKKAA